ncbi:MAG: hypothetical protein AB8B85_12565 [Paracoccaceae bacterium]
MPLSKPIVDILNEVGVHAGIPEQKFIFGTKVQAQPNNEYARKMRSVAYDATRHLMRTRNWEDFWRLAQFSVGPTDISIPLPPDMDRMRTETFFEQNQGWWRPAGPVRAETWSFFRNYPLNTVMPLWRFGEGELILREAPDSTRVFEFEYITQWPIFSKKGEHNTGQPFYGRAKREFEYDTDATIFDNYTLKLELKWRLLKAMGENHAEDRREALQAQDTRAAQEQGGSRPIKIGAPDVDIYTLAPYTNDGLSINVPLY